MHEAIVLNVAFRKGLYKNEPSFFVTVITLEFMILYGYSLNMLRNIRTTKNSMAIDTEATVATLISAGSEYDSSIFSLSGD